MSSFWAGEFMSRKRKLVSRGIACVTMNVKMNYLQTDPRSMERCLMRLCWWIVRRVRNNPMDWEWISQNANNMQCSWRIQTIIDVRTSETSGTDEREWPVRRICCFGRSGMFPSPSHNSLEKTSDTTRGGAIPTRLSKGSASASILAHCLLADAC